MNAAHCTFMSCAFPFHPPMKVANLTFISYINILAEDNATKWL